VLKQHLLTAQNVGSTELMDTPSSVKPRLHQLVILIERVLQGCPSGYRLNTKR
jgi:hypothetical protein